MRKCATRWRCECLCNRVSCAFIVDRMNQQVSLSADLCNVSCKYCNNVHYRASFSGQFQLRLVTEARTSPDNSNRADEPIDCKFKFCILTHGCCRKSWSKNHSKPKRGLLDGGWAITKFELIKLLATTHHCPSVCLVGCLVVCQRPMRMLADRSRAKFPPQWWDLHLISSATRIMMPAVAAAAATDCRKKPNKQTDRRPLCRLIGSSSSSSR